MKNTYVIQGIRTARLKIEADSSLTQEEIFEIAEKKFLKDKKVRWDDMRLNVIDMNIDDKVTEKVKTNVELLPSVQDYLNEENKEFDFEHNS